MSLVQKFYIFASVFVHVAVAQKPGKRFLGSRQRHEGPIQKHGPEDLLMELERLDGGADFDAKAVISSRVDRLETALMPLYKIAPKNADGSLDSNAARYVLHRLFSQRHAWFVNGIELAGGYQNTSRVGEALRSGKRFTLRQLARFAATLETLVHVENIERLKKAFKTSEISMEGSRSETRIRTVIHVYMAYFLSPAMPDSISTYKEAEEFVAFDTPSWPDTKVFADEVTRLVKEGEKDSGETLSLWNFCLRVVEEIGERYGRWQNKDCLDLKASLMELETPGTGRVPLTKFWAPLVSTTKSTWFFTESLPYLKQLGALEGSEAPHHSVVIPNYLYSTGNCMASSKYYDVCCLNECESLLGEIESRIEKPDASPEQLAEALASIPSSTVQAPRELPVALKQRLEDVAARHGGKVPLHGRLFFQLLHHSYPRECPYPYASLSQPVERNADWIQRQTPPARATYEDITTYLEVAQMTDTAGDKSSEELPWTDDEDLFMHSLNIDGDGDESSNMAMSLVLPLVSVLLACLALVFRVWGPLATALGIGGKAPASAYFV
eukprot:TRINITY_DN1668_c0_g1_i4.p1 TRINITY_DN1668_c0_g1~~TRINITY_DN1668_c0_g1_i4.p1  ORF type:complete len:554 (+),score=104.73 TRINITY_DN1668_c0_g1_i4:72-1733(+)